MALQVGSGEITITAAGGTGSKTYAHGLGFTPTLILWFGNGVAAGSALDGDAVWMFGASQDSTHEFCIYGFSDDAAATTGTGSGTSNDASIAFANGTTTYDMQADFTSVDGTNFTLNVSNAPAADKVVQFIAFAGADLDVHVDTITIATGTGSQGFTGVGFTPKLLIFAHGGFAANTVNAVAGGNALGIGAASAAGTEWSNAMCDRNAISPSDANSVITTLRALTVMNNTSSGGTGGNFSLTSLDADGFHVTPSTSFGGNTVVGYIALGGANFSAHVGTEAQATSVTTKAKTGVGFKPQCLLTSGGSPTANNTMTAASRMGFGVAYGAVNRYSVIAANDATNPSNTANDTSAAKNVIAYSASSNAVLSDAALSSFDADGFTQNQTTSNGTAWLFGYIAMRNNAAPVITSNGGGATAAINSAENQTAVTTVTATDADSDTLTYSKSGTDAAFFDIDSSTGVLTWHAAPNFEVKADGDADGVYLVTVTASDGVLTDTQDLSITVTNVNEAPVITSNGGGATAAINVAENTTAVTTVTATDVDAATTLTYSISAGADSALFGIDSTTGVLAFLDAPDYESPADADTDNDYLVTVQVSDGALTDTQALTITVTDVDETPPGAAAGTMRLGIDIGITL